MNIPTLADVPLNPADYHPGLPNIFTGPRPPVNDDLTFIENFFFRVGLTSPIPRALVIGAATTLVIVTFKPGFAFDAAGPREFGFGNGEMAEDGTNPSLFNWWSCGVLAAGLSLVFT